MSPGNGYFTRRRVEIAVCGWASLCGDVAVVVPDSIAVHTYRALGYSEKESRDQVRKNGNTLRNRAQRAIELAKCMVPSARVRLLDWERDVASLPGYSAAFERVTAQFERDPRFRQDALDLCRSVLEVKADGAAVTDAALRECANYLLNEFAYLSLCTTTLEGHVVVPYHRDFAVGQRFCEGGYGEGAPGVGWVVHEIEVGSPGNSAGEHRNDL